MKKTFTFAFVMLLSSICMAQPTVYFTKDITPSHSLRFTRHWDVRRKAVLP